MFFKIGVFKNLALFPGKHLCWSLFLIKLQAFQGCNFIKKRLNTCFPVSAKFLRKLFSQNTSCGCFWGISVWEYFKDFAENWNLFCLFSSFRSNFKIVFFTEDIAVSLFSRKWSWNRLRWFYSGLEDWQKCIL